MKLKERIASIATAILCTASIFSGGHPLIANAEEPDTASAVTEETTPAEDENESEPTEAIEAPTEEAAENPADNDSESIGIKVGSVEIEPGYERVNVPVYVFGPCHTKGMSATFSCAAPLRIYAASNAMAYEEEDDGLIAVFGSQSGWYEGDIITMLTVDIDPYAEPGEYPIDININKLDNNDAPAENPVAISGCIRIVEPPVTTVATTVPEETTTTTTTTTTELVYNNLHYEKVDEDEDGTYDYISITDCDESATEVNIPAEIDGLPVKSIGGFAFGGCSSLTNITIPDNVTSIGSEAFYRCSSLENINASENNNNYSSVDGVLFNKERTVLIQYPIGNTRLEYIIPDSVTSIGFSAFCECSNLQIITIPDSVTLIGTDAFYCCASLTSITINNPKCDIPLLGGTTICNTNDSYSIDGGNGGGTAYIIFNYNGVIYGYKNSTAQEYAEKCGYTFKEIDGEPPVTTIVTTEPGETTTTTVETTANSSTTESTTEETTIATTETEVTTTTTTEATTTTTEAATTTTTEVETTTTSETTVATEPTPTTALTTTTTAASDLPQTGRSGAYNPIVLISLGFLGIGGVFIKCSLKRKEQ